MLLASMGDEIMPCQVPLPTKRLPAIITFVMLLVSMCEMMLFQVPPLSKRLSTLITLVSLLAAVDYLMPHQM